MPKPLLKHTVTWRDRTTATSTSVTYFTAVHDRHAELAEARNAELTSTEKDALVTYQRACEAGEAQFMGHTVEAAE